MLIDSVFSLSKNVSRLRNGIYKYILPKTLLSRFAAIIIIPTLIAQFVIIQIFYYKHWYHVSSYSSRIITREINSLLDDVINKKLELGTNIYNNNLQYSSDIMPDEIAYPLSEATDSIYSQKRYLSLSYEVTKLNKLPKFSDYYLQELEIFKNQMEDSVPNRSSIRLINDNKTIEIFMELLLPKGFNLTRIDSVNSDDDIKILRIILPAKALINPSAFVFIMWFFFLGIFLLVISLIFTKNQIKSILELTKAAEKYGAGQNIEHYKPSGATEIRKAGIAFLRMKDRIERQNAKRTQMLAMISHDLKTPLTRMKLQVALMKDDEDKEELEHDIVTMENMIKSYLDFAKGEGGEEFKMVNIEKWIAEYLKNNWQNILDKTLLYEYNTAQEDTEGHNHTIYAQIKPHSFSRALSNIIENAIKYSSKAILTISSSEEYIIISLEDNGIGIKDSEKKNVFKPFYRCDKSRGLDSSSSVGLGLAITQEIVQGHYGSVFLEDSKKLGGLKIEIRIPIYEN